MYVTFLSRFKEVNTRYLAPNSSLLKGKQYIQKTIGNPYFSIRIGFCFSTYATLNVSLSPHGAVEDPLGSSFSLGITATRFWALPCSDTGALRAETARRTCFSANPL